MTRSRRPSAQTTAVVLALAESPADWRYGYQIHRTGRTQTVCAGVEAVDTRAKLLRYGHRWKRGGFNCFSNTAGLRCHNLSGHGFFISRKHSYRF